MLEDLLHECQGLLQSSATDLISSMAQTESEPDYVPPFMVHVDSVSFPVPMGPFHDLKEAVILAARCARRHGHERSDRVHDEGCLTHRQPVMPPNKRMAASTRLRQKLITAHASTHAASGSYHEHLNFVISISGGPASL
jgi:hypothetical protein